MRDPLSAVYLGSLGRLGEAAATRKSGGIHYAPRAERSGMIGYGMEQAGTATSHAREPALTEAFVARCEESLGRLRGEGRFKTYRTLEGAAGARVRLEGRGEVVLMCSNDYLGLANHPKVVAAGHHALDTFGAGTSAARFVCGTNTAHRALEEGLAAFLGTEAALSFGSGFTANLGLIPSITRPGDAVVADANNHPSSADGRRLAAEGVVREVYAHGDMAELEDKLAARPDAECRFIVTDGVFGSEGDIAKLDRIVDIAQVYEATVVIDDSHGLGVLGDSGRGVAEHYGLMDAVDIYTGTLGKALGGAGGGFVAGPLAVIETLIQGARSHLHTKSIPASGALTALAGLRHLEGHPEIAAKLRAKVRHFRDGLKGLGIAAMPGESAIVAIPIGETAAALGTAEALLDAGVFVVGFGAPAVPEGSARLRVQISNAHSIEDLDEALAAFAGVWRRQAAVSA